MNRSYNQILIFTVGDGLLRLGHAHVLTVHRTVIHSVRAASLPPGHPEKRTIIVCETGGETPPLRVEYYFVVGEAFRLPKTKDDCKQTSEPHCGSLVCYFIL